MSKDLNKLVDDLSQSRLSRRQFVTRAAALGLSMSAIGSILAACGGTAATPEATETTAAEGGAAETAAAGTRPPKNGSKYRMGVVHVGLATTGGWDSNQNNGYKALRDEMGWEISIAENADYAKSAEIMRGWASEGYDIITATSGGYGDILLEVAPEFPDVQFVMVSDLDSTNDIPNLCAYRADWQPLGYVWGWYGCMATKTDKLGMSTCTPIFSSDNSIAGILYAVEQWNKANGTNLELLVSYAGTWTDPAKLKESTLALLDQGAGVILSLDSSAEQGIFEAAAERNVSCTSYFVDRHDEFPILSSGPAWDLAKVYKEMADGYINNKLESKVYTSTFAAEQIGLLPYYNDVITKEQEAELQELMDGFKDGSFTIPELEPYDAGDVPTEG